ncbi:MAG: ankyrin repeat domain-containing protein, partial [Verrucomicrobiota bacterium]|nr:ankyrin repeat domain-containing protein [Verrucomicrobiota bacterium]
TVSPEDQEIRRIKALIKDSPDLINANKTPLSGGDNPDLGTPLHKAARDGQLAVAKFLLENGANVNGLSVRNTTPLFLAAQSGNRAMLELLISKGADVNAKDSSGRTALHLAAEQGFKAVVQLLVENKADVNAKDYNDRTPLFSTVPSANLEMAKFLIANKADVNAVAKENWTPLHTAVSIRQSKLVELLLQNGAKVEAKLNDNDHKGWTPLHFAVGLGEKEIVEILLNNGANPNSTNDLGLTPLHYAASGDQKEIAELLLAHKADVNAKAADGDTPLLWAVKALKKPIVELLLTKKADPNLANSLNKTPLNIVNEKETGSPAPYPPRQIPSTDSIVLKEIKELLIKYGADENAERLTRISLSRKSRNFLQPVFYKGTNSWNRFSLLEAFAQGNAGQNIIFPDLTKVEIHRLNSKTSAEEKIPVNLEEILKSGDCAKDIWLQWGDVIEIPETDYKLEENWKGFPQEILEMLPKCLSRKVSVSVKGETKPISLEPKMQVVASSPQGVNIVTGQPVELQKWWGVRGLDFWLNNVVSNSGLLRTSSDKTHVKVTHIDPVTKKSEELVFNLEKPSGQTDLWLRDGDVIEIPEKN